MTFVRLASDWERVDDPSKQMPRYDLAGDRAEVNDLFEQEPSACSIGFKGASPTLSMMKSHQRHARVNERLFVW